MNNTNINVRTCSDDDRDRPFRKTQTVVSRSNWPGITAYKYVWRLLPNLRGFPVVGFHRVTETFANHKGVITLESFLAVKALTTVKVISE